MRCNHCHLGYIPSEEFIQLAEESDLIIELGSWILEKACKIAATWPKPLVLAVNVSALQALRSSFVPMVLAAIHLAGLDVRRLELGVTEALFLELPENGFDSLFTIKKLGVHVVLDDFGTGYSSINHLRLFPFDKVKFDPSLLADLAVTGKGADVFSAMLALRHSLDIQTAVERIETQAQLKQIEGHACDQVQGFLLGSPMPTGELGRLLEARVRVKNL